MVLLGFGELFRKVWGMPHEQPSSPAPAGVRRRGFSRIAPTSASSSYDSLPFPEEDASACGWCYNLQPRTAPTQIGLRDLRPLDMAPPGVVVPVERSPAGGFLPVHTRTGSSSQDAGDHRVTATRSGRPRDHLAMEVESSPTGQERRVHRGEASITSVAEKLKHLGLKLFHYIVSGSFPSSSPGRPAAVFPYDEDTFDIEAGQPSIDNQTAANSTGGVELRRRGRHNVPTSGTHGAGAEARENLRREAAKELLKQIADALSIPQSLARLVYVGAIPLWTTFLLHRPFTSATPASTMAVVGMVVEMVSGFLVVTYAHYTIVSVHSVQTTALHLSRESEHTTAKMLLLFTCTWMISYTIHSLSRMDVGCHWGLPLGQRTKHCSIRLQGPSQGGTSRSH